MLSSIFYSHVQETPTPRRKQVGPVAYRRWPGSHRPPRGEPVLAPARGGLPFACCSLYHHLSRWISWHDWHGPTWPVPSPRGSPCPVALWCRAVPSVLVQKNAPSPTCLRLLPTRHPKQPWDEVGTGPFHRAESFSLTHLYLCSLLLVLVVIIAALWWKGSDDWGCWPQTGRATSKHHAELVHCRLENFPGEKKVGADKRLLIS